MMLRLKQKLYCLNNLLNALPLTRIINSIQQFLGETICIIKLNGLATFTKRSQNTNWSYSQNEEGLNVIAIILIHSYHQKTSTPLKLQFQKYKRKVIQIS